jgi:hypothetical protein
MGDECEVDDAELNAVGLTSEQMEAIVKNKHKISRILSDSSDIYF